MRKVLLFGLCALALLGCTQRNPKFEKTAKENNLPYEIVAQTETLFQDSTKNNRLTDAQWAQVDELSRSDSKYVRSVLIFVATGVDRTDAPQRQRALEVLGRLKQDSDPEVRRYAERGYARTLRIPEKGP